MTTVHRGIITYFQMYGSVIPRVLPFAVLGAAEGVLAKWASNNFEAFNIFNHWQQGGAWYHPYAFHVFSMLLGFALVMRIQSARNTLSSQPSHRRRAHAQSSSSIAVFSASPPPLAHTILPLPPLCTLPARVACVCAPAVAYARYWEGTTQCHQAASKWADAVMQIMAFDEASKDAFSEEALEFRMLVMHYTSLMNACALIDIRRDDDLDAPLTLNREDPYLFRPNANSALLAAAGSSSSGGDDGSPEKDGTAGGLERRKAGKKAGISARAYTTPMQMLLTTRRNLMKKLNTDINSFEAVESDAGGHDGQRPVSFASGAADMRCRVRKRDTTESSEDLFSTSQGHAVAGNSVASDVSRAKLRRGSLTVRNAHARACATASPAPPPRTADTLLLAR